MVTNLKLSQARRECRVSQRGDSQSRVSSRERMPRGIVPHSPPYRCLSALQAMWPQVSCSASQSLLASVM